MQDALAKVSDQILEHQRTLCWQAKNLLSALAGRAGPYGEACGGGEGCQRQDC